MIDICPIKVWIGLRQNGHADHPNWDLVDLSDITDSPTRGNGRHADDYVLESWIYDKCCGHDEATPESPLGGRWGVRLVTPQFARNAAKAFPATVSPIDEVELEDFYENHAMSHLPEDSVNEEALAAIKTEIELRTLVGDPPAAIDALKAQARRALDPNDKEPGKSKNPRRHYTGLKGLLGVVVKPVAP